MCDRCPGIMDGKIQKLSRLLTVSKRDWRKLPAEAGLEAAEKTGHAQPQPSP